MKPEKSICLALAVLIRIATLPAHSQPAIICQHSGFTDPTAEGFSVLTSGSPSLTPVMADLGHNAWGIGLNSGADIAQYSRSLTPQEKAEAGANGWIMSLTLRIVPPFSSPTYGMFAQFSMGGKSIAVLFGAENTGDPVVRLGGTYYTVTGGDSGYHNYELMYSPQTEIASLWVDGSYLAETAGSQTLDTAKFSWGGGQHPPGSAYANWSDVSLSIIPEPNSASLLWLGALLSIFLHRRLRP